MAAEDELTEAILVADDLAARRLEETAVVPTDNGWQSRDPLNQPDNPEPWTT